jgi:acetoin utilization deacetylase AcuC-like enzyme
MTRALTSAGAAVWLFVTCVCALTMAGCAAGPDTAVTAAPCAEPVEKSGAASGERSPSMIVGLVWDERYLAHAAPNQVECPARLAAIRHALEEASLWNSLVHIRPAPADEACLLRVHSREYIARVRASARTKELIWFDSDTYACGASWDAAVLAAGGVCAAVDAVMKGQVRSAFCAVRPPGHHATCDRAMGFCIFNNVAVGVRHAQAVHKVRRVVIIDWDVHHGNGTQEIFWREPDVMYISFHQSPFYPGTGSAKETGDGPGKGHIHNFPLPARSGDKEFLAALDEGLKCAEEFRPDFVFISAGFDAHKNDTLGGLAVTEEGYAEATRRVRRMAEASASGRIVSVLEGGYDEGALGRSVVAHVKALAAP